VSTVPGVGLTPSSGGPPSRRSRERRAYQLVVVGGTAGLIAVVGFVLAAVGVMGFGIPFLAAIVAVVCALIFRRTVSR
jgi:putative flippase GtrA